MNINLQRAVLPITLPVLSLMGCSDPTGPGSDRHKGIIVWVPSVEVTSAAGPAAVPGTPTDGSIEVLEAPDEVTAGEEFQVVVTTVGASSCWESERVTLELEAGVAGITPWDRDLMLEGAVCMAVLVALPREVTLSFTEPGEAVIRVLGRRVVGGDVEGATDVVVEKTITVVGG